jgi:hypothetical protein
LQLISFLTAIKKTLFLIWGTPKSIALNCSIETPYPRPFSCFIIDVICCVEIDKKQMKLYKKNLNPKNSYLGDIREAPSHFQKHKPLALLF